MKSLYESLLTGNVSKPSAKVQPRSNEELQRLISEHIEEIKPRPGQEVDLNWIDISGVDDLSSLFKDTNYIPVIDTWKIDHVKDFSYMFAHNKYIVRSPLPVLQSKLRRSYCYSSMFWDCSSLKVAPALPATKLAVGCYAYMFLGCRSLKITPELPATELTENCYRSMFRECRSLVEPPTLPATKLAPYCYYAMFEKCRSLKVAPELPATELVVNCYHFMFQNCDNLKAKAKVPTGVDLDRSTAQGMYTGCPCENK